MSWSTRTHAALALVVLVTLAGCSGALLGSEDPEEIAEQVQDRHDAIEDMHGVQTTSIDGPDANASTTSEVWQVPPDQTRQEVRSTSGPESYGDSAGDVVVQNGSNTWYYDSDANEVTRMNVSSALAGNSMVDGTTIERLLEQFDVSHAGTETVADRETHVLELAPANESDSGMAAYEDAKVWVDSEYWYPLKYEVALSLGNETTTVTMAFEEIEFNQGIDEERFEFEPPEGAEVRESLGANITQVDDLAAADERTAVDVGEPAIPEEYTVDSVQVAESGSETSVTSTFSNDADGMLAYAVTPTGHLPDGESVQVGDADGVLRQSDAFTGVYVQCDGVLYSATSDGASEDELVDALAALECT